MLYFDVPLGDAVVNQESVSFRQNRTIDLEVPEDWQSEKLSQPVVVSCSHPHASSWLLCSSINNFISARLVIISIRKWRIKTQCIICWIDTNLNSRSPSAALVQLNAEEGSKASPTEIEQQIWKVHEQVPSRSCLVRPLIRILSDKQTFPVTQRRNLMRRKTNPELFTLIDTIYEKFLQWRQNKENSSAVVEHQR